MAAVVNVLYGSETGTAEDVAYKVCAALSRHGADCRAQALDDFDYPRLFSGGAETLTVVFVVSTTGDGKPPSNMRAFWKYILRRNWPSGILHSLKFSVFGLGDSSYEKYNAAARMLRKRLLQLSAAEFVSIGLGDDQSGFGYLGGLDPWMSQLLGALYPSASMTGQPQLGPEEYIVSVSSSEEEIDSVIETQPAFGQFQGIYGTHLVGPFTATVVSNERLTDPVWPQTVCNIRLRAEAEYNCGDVAVVHPRIPAPLVARALKATGIRASSVCSIRRVGRFGGTRRGRIGSVVSTAEGLFTHFLDIAGIPQRSYFELLSFFATDAEEKEKLIELSSGAGTDLYFDYCFREKRNFVDVLEDFASCRCQVPLQRLLEVIPTLKPREYSIASAPSEFLGQIDLCVALLEERTPYKRTRLGTCSNYLCTVTASSLVHIWINPCGPFSASPSEVNQRLHLSSGLEGAVPQQKLPPECLLPMLLVGPGTGVAPMRSVMRQRLHIKARTGASDTDFGCAMLFFGCRKKESDYLYEDEWNELLPADHSRHGHILCSGKNEVFVAFSRNADDRSSSTARPLAPGGGQYVTHMLEDNGSCVWNKVLSQEGCIVYIAGAAKKMPLDVRASIKKIIMEHSSFYKSAEQAEKYMQFLESSNRYILDVWS